MSKNPSGIGLSLFIITMIIFFAVYYFFSGIHYFDTSIKINAFVLPVLYCGFAFYSVYILWKKQGRISFREGFRSAFIPMFVGGFLSMAAMAVFLNTADTDARDLLNFQYVQRQKSELDNEYHKAKKILKHKEDDDELEKKYQERLQSFAPEKVKNKNMLTYKHFFTYFAAILLFYVIISAFFGAFFRSRSAR